MQPAECRRPLRAAHAHLVGMVGHLFTLEAKGWARDLSKIESKQ